MKRSSKINKIYYDIFIKDKVFKTPYFVVYNLMNNKFCVFKNIKSPKLFFKNFQSAICYIDKIEKNPIIIILPTQK